MSFLYTITLTHTHLQLVLARYTSTGPASPGSDSNVESADKTKADGHQFWNDAMHERYAERQSAPRREETMRRGRLA